MRRFSTTVAFALIATLCSAAEPRKTPMAVGEAAPDFSLQDQNGQTVKLSLSKGERPAVLVFYRGYW